VTKKKKKKSQSRKNYLWEGRQTRGFGNEWLYIYVSLHEMDTKFST